jgi:hypothetical protein
MKPNSSAIDPSATSPSMQPMQPAPQSANGIQYGPQDFFGQGVSPDEGLVTGWSFHDVPIPSQ